MCIRDSHQPLPVEPKFLCRHAGLYGGGRRIRDLSLHQFIQRYAEHSTQFHQLLQIRYAGVVFPLADRLPGYSQLLRQGILTEPCFCPQLDQPLSQGHGPASRFSSAIIIAEGGGIVHQGPLAIPQPPVAMNKKTAADVYKRQTVTGVESYAFPYEFLEDRWVFTDFHLIY